MIRPLLTLLAAAVLAVAPVTGAGAATEAPDALHGTYEVQKGQTLHDIAIEQNLGFLELKAANPDVDHWLPKPGSTIVLPNVHMVPKRFDNGILVNVAAMRLFRFDAQGQVTKTFPIGVGREGRETPMGATTVVRKKQGPTWYPTDNTRKEKPHLPKVVPPGPENPLGTHALYLGWPTYLLHGTDNDYGIGRRVSAGCLRMYNPDVEALFSDVPVGTKVEVMDQRVLAQVYQGRLYVEAHPTPAGWDAMELGGERPESVLTTDLVAIVTAATPPGMFIDWDAVAKVIAEERGYPIAVSPAPSAQAGLGPQELIPASLEQ
ncbi:L,D-transpeptidase family protein [Novispirillum sp. DQ9]|uniref:L,D-transpeptidase family protein n=1 Tax=Novispirillum sp. DQ9 TaxID=3398612 RepID=UPI003C7A2EEB